MKKILFLNFGLDNTVFLGPLSLATILHDKGHCVKIINSNQICSNQICSNQNISLTRQIEIISSYILEGKFDIVDFYTMSNNYHACILIAKYIKNKYSNIKILFGGPQASLTAKLSLEAFPWIDVIGIGEGERTIEYLIEALDNTDHLRNIKGIAYRKNNDVFVNTDVELITNLDELPIMNYNLIDMKNLDTFSLDVGRGCPFSCTYCSTKTFWKRNYRLKSINRIIQEIKHLKEEYNINTFIFLHDLFTFNKNIIIDFCNTLIKENLNISWYCSSRADTLDEELIKKLYEAGCSNIFLGIETGSINMQKSINKNLDLNQALNNIDILNKYHIKIHVSFIYGFPNETIEDIKQTLDMIRICIEKKISLISLHKCTIFPGTQLFEEVKDNLELDLVFSSMVDDINDESRELIKNNPYIFPQYYNFKSYTRTKFLYLDRFVLMFQKIFKDAFNSTYSILIHYYDNDLLKLYSSMVESCSDFKYLEEENFYSIFNIDVRFKILKELIVQNNFGEISELLNEVFKFESDMLDFLSLNNNSDQKIYMYKFDVYKLKAFGFNQKSIYSKKIKLAFYKTEVGQLKIKPMELPLDSMI